MSFFDCQYGSKDGTAWDLSIIGKRTQMAITLKDILAEFDNPETKQFSYYDVASAIGKQLPKDQLSLPEVRSEMLAMQFQDNTGQDIWNTYYGPFLIGEENVTKKPVYNPDIVSVKAEDIECWKKRARETNNPFLKMRYAGLVFDFHKKIFGKDADYKTIKLPYVQSVIKVVKEDYFSYIHEGYVYAERALSCARGFKNQDLIDEAKGALRHLEEKYGIDDTKPGWWCKGFELMMKYEDVFSEEEMVQKLAEHVLRLERIEKQALKEGYRTDEYAHLADSEVKVLCKYYAKHNKHDRIEELLYRLYLMFKAAKPARGAMWYHGMLDQLQNRCREYQCEKLARRLYVDIQENGPEAMQEMKSINIPIEIKNEIIEAYLDDFLSGSDRDIWDKYIMWNTPKLKEEKEALEDEAKESPLFDLMSTVVYDVFGNPMRKLGHGENQAFAKLMYSMYQRMQISTIFMNFEKKKMIDKGILTVEALMQAFEKSPFIHDSQRSILKRGFESYLAGDYLVACHLLIPQFESAIRMMVKILGGEILKQDKKPDDGNQYITLNGLLTSDTLKNSGVPEDMLVYFQNLFTNQFGWNLRNLVCHGLLTENGFDEGKADRIVHALMIISTIELKNKEDVTTAPQQ